jgi:hypothetical protein
MSLFAFVARRRSFGSIVRADLILRWVRVGEGLIIQIRERQVEANFSSSFHIAV